MNINQAASNFFSGAVAAIDRLCNNNDANGFSYIPGICPVADKFIQFDVVKLLHKGLTEYVPYLTEGAQKYSFDIYDRPSGRGDAFRYGIRGGLKCERREWFGTGDSQFDVLIPTAKGFEFTRRFDVCKETLQLKCTADKVKLHCKIGITSFNGVEIKYEVNENKASIREKLCQDKECERSTTAKGNTPPLLKKLLDLTNKA